MDSPYSDHNSGSDLAEAATTLGAASQTSRSENTQARKDRQEAISQLSDDEKAEYTKWSATATEHDTRVAQYSIQLRAWKEHETGDRPAAIPSLPVDSIPEVAIEVKCPRAIKFIRSHVKKIEANIRRRVKRYNTAQANKETTIAAQQAHYKQSLAKKLAHAKGIQTRQCDRALSRYQAALAQAAAAYEVAETKAKHHFEATSAEVVRSNAFELEEKKKQCDAAQLALNETRAKYAAVLESPGV